LLNCFTETIQVKEGRTLVRIGLYTVLTPPLGQYRIPSYINP